MAHALPFILRALDGTAETLALCGVGDWDGDRFQALHDSGTKLTETELLELCYIWDAIPAENWPQFGPVAPPAELPFQARVTFDELQWHVARFETAEAAVSHAKLSLLGQIHDATAVVERVHSGPAGTEWRPVTTINWAAAGYRADWCRDAGSGDVEQFLAVTDHGAATSTLLV